MVHMKTGFENDGALWTFWGGGGFAKKKKKSGHFLFMTKFFRGQPETKLSYRGAILYIVPQAPQTLATLLQGRIHVWSESAPAPPF